MFSEKQKPVKLIPILQELLKLYLGKGEKYYKITSKYEAMTKDIMGVCEVILQWVQHLLAWVDLGLIPDTPYGPVTTARSDP